MKRPLKAQMPEKKAAFVSMGARTLLSTLALWGFLPAWALVQGCTAEEAPTALEAPTAPPRRTAAATDALNRLMLDLAAQEACPALLGHLLPLPEERSASDEERSSTEGRWWIERCEIERDGQILHLNLQGRGWRWVDQVSSGPLASQFRAQGVLRFDASVALNTRLDLAYEEGLGEVRLSLSPGGAPGGIEVEFHPLSTLPVAAVGGWSDLVGGLAGLFGQTTEQNALPLIERQGRSIFRQTLGRGATLRLNVCSGQPDFQLGALGDGRPATPAPYGDEEPWIDNGSSLLRADAFDLSGPYEKQGAGLLFDAQLSAAGAADNPTRLSLLCEEDARRLIEAHLSEEPLANVSAIASTVLGEEEVHLRAPAEGCDKVYLWAQGAPADPRQSALRLRYRVRREGAEESGWLDCPESE